MRGHVHTVESMLEFRFTLPVDREVARLLVQKLDSLSAAEPTEASALRSRCKVAALWMSRGDLDTLSEVIDWGCLDPDSLIATALEDMQVRRTAFVSWLAWP